MAWVRLRCTDSVREGSPRGAGPGAAGAGRRHGPGAQARLELRPDRRGRDVAGHRDDRALGPVGRPVEGRHVVPGDGTERGLGSGHGAAVGVLGKRPAASAGAPPPSPGSSSERRTDASTSSRFRSNSVSGNAGRRRASARRSRPSPRSFRSTDSTTSLESRPPSPSRLPPTNSMARSTSRADRVALPRVRSSAVRLATPPLSGGSSDRARLDRRAGDDDRDARPLGDEDDDPVRQREPRPARGCRGCRRARGRWQRLGTRRRGQRRDGSGQDDAPHGGQTHGGIIPAPPSPAPAGAAPPTCPGARGRARRPRGSPACSARARAARD